MTEKVSEDGRLAPKKKETKEFVAKCMELIGTFRRPKIVMPGYEDMTIPQNTECQILVERLLLAKNEEKMASEAETLWYLSTASLVMPFDYSWYKIYMYLFKQWCRKSEKELPDFAKEQIVLEEFEEHDLKRLRDWIYKKSTEALKDVEVL